MRMKAGTAMTVSALAGVGASACCAGPLILLLLGFGGPWVAQLTAFEPYRPYLIATSALMFVLAFRALYLVPQPCEPGQVCADPRVRRRQRAIFWAIVVLVTPLMTLPWYAPLFY